MLQIQEVAVDMVRGLRAPLVLIDGADRDLGRQVRRAAASVVLNMGEGSGSSGGTRRERYRSALGSLRQAEAALTVAVAFGYIAEADVASCAARVAAGRRKLALGAVAGGRGALGAGGGARGGESWRGAGGEEREAAAGSVFCAASISPGYARVRLADRRQSRKSRKATIRLGTIPPSPPPPVR